LKTLENWKRFHEKKEIYNIEIPQGFCRLNLRFFRLAESEIIKFYPLNSEMHPEQKKSYQAMTPEQKLQVALDLYYSAREIKTAGLKSQHPDWTEDTIRQKVREIFLYART
jgi:hypothetical protein